MEHMRANFPLKERKISRSFIRRLVDILFGYDFFISYAWKYRSEDGQWNEDGRLYAVELNNILEKEGFQCFLDSNEYHPGDNWRLVGRLAIRKTSRLILIVTRGAICSEPVERELESFLETNRDIIPIDCEGILDQRQSEIKEGTYSSSLRFLNLLSPDVLFLSEGRDRLALGPTNEILQKIRDRFQGDRQDRKRVRWLTYAVVAFAMLAFVAVLSAYIAERQRRETVRQQLLVESASSINESDLLRETRGPELNRSFELAVAAYENSRIAGEPSGDSQRAILQAIELLPERIGEAWGPFANGAPIDSLYAVDDQLLLVQQKRAQEGTDVYAVVADLDDKSKRWHVARSFTANNHGQFLMVTDNGRCLATKRNHRVVLWDVTNGSERGELPFDHEPDVINGSELLALSSGGNFLAARIGRQVEIWEIRDSTPVRIRVLAKEYRLANYALSPSGQWMSWAAQNEFVLIRVSDGEEILNRQITQGGGHVQSLGFLGDQEGNDRAIYVSWSANQVHAQQPSAKRKAPHYEAAIWRLDREILEPQVPIQSVPNTSLLRQYDFRMVFGQTGHWDELSLAILDPRNPVQWLNVDSQISQTVGAAAGSGTDAVFAQNSNDLLIVHTDGTARLWSPTLRKELLRFTGADDIVSATFLHKPNSDRLITDAERAVVTADKQGRVQAWAIRRVPPTRLQFLAKSAALTPDRQTLLFDSGRLLALADVSPNIPSAASQQNAAVHGFIRGASVRINSTATSAAVFVEANKIRTHRDASLEWFDLLKKTSKPLSLGEFESFQDFVLSDDGRRVIAWCQEYEKDPIWLVWDVAKSESTTPISHVLRKSRVGDDLKSAGYVVLDPLGRFVWQLTHDGKLSRDDGVRLRVLTEIDRKVAQIPVQNLQSENLAAPDGAYVAFPLDGAALVAQPESERVTVFALKANEEILCVSSRGLLAVGVSKSWATWTDVRIVNPYAHPNAGELWSFPSDLDVHQFAFGRFNDLVAIQTGNGDVSIYSILGQHQLAQMPNLPVSNRLKFVGNDRFLILQEDELAYVHFWKPDDLIAIGRRLQSN